MPWGWRSVLAVFLAMGVVVAGVVIVVQSQQGSAVVVGQRAGHSVQRACGGATAQRLDADLTATAHDPRIEAAPDAHGRRWLPARRRTDPAARGTGRRPPAGRRGMATDRNVLDGRRPVLGYSRPTVTPEGTLDWEIVR